MRIAILADPLDNQKAGVHVYTRELIKALVDKQSQHTYFLIRLKKDPTLKGIEQIELPAINYPIGYMSLRMFVIIPYIIRKHKIDLVIEPAHFGPFNLPKRIARVTVIHDLTPIKFPHFHNFHSQLLQRIFLPSILKRARLIISNSQSTSRDIAQTYGISKNKIATILLGKDTFYHRTSERTFLDKYKIEKPFFHFVGTVEPRKDLVTLLKAYTLFRQSVDKPVKLYIAGSKGWKADAFYEALDQNPFKDEITILGFVEKELLRELNVHTKAMIYPSIYEGFGFPVLETLSCGGKVICSDNSSLPEVGGSFAHYFPTGDHEQLTQKMIEVFNEKEDDSYIEKAQAWSNSFSWTTYADQFEKALEQIMK